jgi:RNA polymerase sigma factor (sigma-70 family)
MGLMLYDECPTGEARLASAMVQVSRRKILMEEETGSFTVQVWIDRLRGGDDSAREALLARAFDRLTRLARKMLRHYPGVGRWEQTDDVLQNALIRLDRALRSVAPSTAKDFFRLAATQIRRELIDLARRYDGPEGIGCHHSSHGGVDLPSPSGGLTDTAQDPGVLTEWTEFHQRVEALPDDERVMFDLLWYQGLNQTEAAETLGISERTVNRHWIKARLKLCDSLGGQLPG